jgi:hypothetical protein
MIHTCDFEPLPTNFVSKRWVEIIVALKLLPDPFPTIGLKRKILDKGRRLGIYSFLYTVSKIQSGGGPDGRAKYF